MNIDLNPQDTGVVVVDVQGDFTMLMKGSLAVEDTDQAYVDKLTHVTKQLKGKGFKIFATRDYHPEIHISFYTSHKNRSPFEVIEIQGRSQILWPPHCVIGTPNAELLLPDDLFTSVITKGMNPQYDSYSGFYDDSGAGTGLEDALMSFGLSNLIIYGLATDYCVKATALDAVSLGFKVSLMEDMCRGVAEETRNSALAEMKEAGIYRS